MTTPYARQHVRGGARNESQNVHVLIVERVLGRKLPRGAHVHHVDGNKRNNANTNLVVCQDQRYHFLLHCRTRTLKAGGNPNTHKVCCGCKAVKPFADFNLMRGKCSDSRQSHCRECSKTAHKAWREARRAKESRAA